MGIGTKRSVTKYELSKIEIGQTAEVDILGTKYSAQVKNISHVAFQNENGGIVFAAELELDNPDDVYLGVESNVDILLFERRNVLLIPSEAVNTDTQGTFVYIVEEGIVKRRDVECGVLSNSIQEIVGGLSEGDVIITQITSDIHDGMELKTE